MKMSCLVLSAALAAASPLLAQSTAAPEAGQPVAVEAESPPGGSKTHPAVFIGLGVVIGILVIIAALDGSSPGIPDTSPY